MGEPMATISGRLCGRCLSCAHALIVNQPTHLKIDCAARCAHVEPPQDCARDELMLWLVAHCTAADLDAEAAWFLGWAQRRNANLAQRAAEFLADVADGDELDKGFAHRIAAELIGMKALTDYVEARRQRRATADQAE